MAEGAGWYADPSGKTGAFRWWDGTAWTRWLSTDPAAPDPGPVSEPPGRPGTRGRPGTPGRPGPLAHLGPPANEAGSTGYAPADLSAYAPPDPADRVVRLPAAAAILVGAVLLALIAMGAVITLTADRPFTGPAVDPPPPTRAPLTISYDPATRTAAIEELRVVLPAQPFRCDDQPLEVPGVFEAAISCQVAVHTDYDDKGSDWSASAGLGLLPEVPRTEQELRERLAVTAGAVLDRYYETDDITIKKARNRPFPDVARPGRARVVTAELHLSYRGLPTDFDTMRIAIFHLESDRYALWWNLVPEDSPVAVRSAVDASVETITARK